MLLNRPYPLSSLIDCGRYVEPLVSFMETNEFRFQILTNDKKSSYLINAASSKHRDAGVMVVDMPKTADFCINISDQIDIPNRYYTIFINDKCVSCNSVSTTYCRGNTCISGMDSVSKFQFKGGIMNISIRIDVYIKNSSGLHQQRSNYEFSPTGTDHIINNGYNPNITFILDNSFVAVIRLGCHDIREELSELANFRLESIKTAREHMINEQNAILAILDKDNISNYPKTPIRSVRGCPSWGAGVLEDLKDLKISRPSNNNPFSENAC
jgi:hypothetical protein